MGDPGTETGIALTGCEPNIFVDCVFSSDDSTGIRIAAAPVWLVPTGVEKVQRVWPSDFAAWVAAPFWMLTWMLTLGRFGWPIGRAPTTEAEEKP